MWRCQCCVNLWVNSNAILPSTLNDFKIKIFIIVEHSSNDRQKFGLSKWNTMIKVFVCAKKMKRRNQQQPIDLHNNLSRQSKQHWVHLIKFISKHCWNHHSLTEWNYRLCFFLFILRNVCEINSLHASFPNRIVHMINSQWASRQQSRSSLIRCRIDWFIYSVQCFKCL